MKHRLGALFGAALIAIFCIGSLAAKPEQQDSAQAKAKLAAVPARIGELTNRMGTQLAQRESLSARVRETELLIAAKRQRVEDLRVAQAAVERKRAELRSEEGRNLAALQAE